MCSSVKKLQQQNCAHLRKVLQQSVIVLDVLEVVLELAGRHEVLQGLHNQTLQLGEPLGVHISTVQICTSPEDMGIRNYSASMYKQVYDAGGETVTSGQTQQ